MLARGVRNVIYNYTDAQRKVRSATSNDAWGPSPALMHEIANLTDNAVAYSEMMPVIWKRLNDHGKNWRHVYKSLVLLDHLIKFGNERVIQHCKQNIFSIQVLKDFQHVEDQKDQGYNVREKAKQLVALLKDDERLRNERRKAQEARQHYVRQTMGTGPNAPVPFAQPTMRRNSMEGGNPYGGASYMSPHDSNSYSTANRSTSYNESLHSAAGRDYGQPASQEEEQMQLQIALAESQREAENEERQRRNDDLKLKIALERSVHATTVNSNDLQSYDPDPNSGHLSSSIFDPSPNYGLHSSPLPPPPTTTSSIGWSTGPITQPSAQFGILAATNDPWGSESNTYKSTTVTNDPWSNATTPIYPPISNPQPNPWNEIKNTTTSNNGELSINLSDPWGIGAASTQPTATAAATTTKTTSIENELKDLFGTTRTPSIPYDEKHQVSSNPWTMPPSNMNNTSGNLLYPTMNTQKDSNANSPSPLTVSSSAARKTPESFLGDTFGNLVDLDKLVVETKNTNPFSSNVSRNANPFLNTNKAPTLEQLTTSYNNPIASASGLPPPLIPSTYNNNSNTIASFNSNNPFM